MEKLSTTMTEDKPDQPDFTAGYKRRIIELVRSNPFESECDVCDTVLGVKAILEEMLSAVKEENKRLLGTIKLGIDVYSDDVKDLRSQIEKLEEENKQLREALDEIMHPVKYMQRRAEAQGHTINGHMAIQLSDSVSYMREIAQKVMSKYRPECSQKVNGSCPLHNVHCAYPKCEEL
jgi:predicted nuclease with TOPRIM domain